MNKKTLFALFAVVLMTSGIFALISDIPSGSQTSSSPVNQSAAFPTSGTADMSSSISYFQNVAIPNSGTTTDTLSYSENSSQSSVNLFSSELSWTVSTDKINVTYTFPPMYYFGNSNIGLLWMALPVPIEYDPTTASSRIDVGTLFYNLSGDGSYEHRSTVYNVNAPFGDAYAYIAAPLFWPYVAPTSDVPFTINFSITAPLNSGYTSIYIANTPNGDYGYTMASPASGVTSVVINPASMPPQVSQPFVFGWHWNSVSGTYSSVPSDLTSYSVTYSSTYAGIFTVDSTSSLYESSGSVSGPLALSFTYSFNPDGNDPNIASSWTVTFQLVSQLQATSETTTESPTSSQSIVQAQNYFNSSLSFSLSNPSGALDNTALATTSGTLNAGTDATWSVMDITVAGYGNSPAIDMWSYSGYQSGSISLGSSPPQYETITESSSQAIPTTGLTVSYNIAEFINYNPTVSTPSTSFISGSTIQTQFTTSEVISGELENLVINWGDGSTTSLNAQTPGTFTEDHTYSGSYTNSFSQSYNPYVTVTNIPNAPVSNQLSTQSSSGSYSFSLTTIPTIPESVLQVGSQVWMNYSQSNINFNQASVTIDGIAGTAIQSTTNHWYTTSSLFGKSGVTITWTLATSQVIDTESIAYSSPLFPSNLSTDVTFTGSNTVTNVYPITISGSPSGTGTYQQEMTITNPSTYGINDTGDNFQITYTNSTPAYSWIQSINSTSLVVWSKLYNGTSTVDLQVFPSFVNLLSATGSQLPGNW